jgi:hypothetical protein
LAANFLGEDLIHGLAVQIPTYQRTVTIEPQRDVATIISEPRGIREAPWCLIFVESANDGAVGECH